MPRTNVPLEQRFWKKVHKTDACWIWTGARTGRSSCKYGYFKVPWATNAVVAHRVSWVFANGAIPDDLKVLHKCDNPPCVRPDHLFLGTQMDNVQDRMRKGRSVSGERCALSNPANRHVAMGEMNPAHRYSDAHIAVVRTEYERCRNMVEVSRRTGVSPTHVTRIVRREARAS